MDESRPETHVPEHHSYRAKPVILILIGLSVAQAVFRRHGLVFHEGLFGGGPSGFKRDATKSSSARAGDGNFVLEKDICEIVPLSEVQVKIVSGNAESVETPKIRA